MSIRRATTFLLLTLACGWLGCSSRTLDRAPVGLARPVAAETDPPPFNNLFADGAFYFAGQPTEEGLRRLAAEGVTTVVNLRTQEEMDRIGFDEPALVEELGMVYVHLPMSGASYGAETVAAFAEELSRTRGKLLLHCGSSNRVGALWANYLHEYRDLPLNEAIERGTAAGMREGLIETVRKVAEE